MSDHKRKHLRAPIQTKIIYVKGGQVLKGELVNISEGGILARYLPSLEIDEELSAILDIPSYPSFQNYSMEQIRKFYKDSFSRKIFRIRLKAARKLTDPTSSKVITQNYVGLYFLTLTNEAQTHISAYVKSFAQNVIFLLKILEGQRAQDWEDIRLMAGLLNYDHNQKMSLLRQQILHDYQSMQWI